MTKPGGLSLPNPERPPRGSHPGLGKLALTRSSLEATRYVKDHSHDRSRLVQGAGHGSELALGPQATVQDFSTTP